MIDKATISIILALSVTVLCCFAAVIPDASEADGETYAIIYDGNGGSPQKSVSYVQEGAQVDLLPVAVRAGYAHAGWSLSPTGIPLESLIATEDTVLYAVWLDAVDMDQYIGTTEYHVTEDHTHLGLKGMFFQSIPYLVIVFFAALCGWFVYTHYRY